ANIRTFLGTITQELHQARFFLYARVRHTAARIRHTAALGRTKMNARKPYEMIWFLALSMVWFSIGCTSTPEPVEPVRVRLADALDRLAEADTNAADLIEAE